MDMIFEFDCQDRRKKPTLLQFLGSPESEKLKVKYNVEIVWFPNQFPTICLETEYFRINIDESSPLYDSFHVFCSHMVDEGTPFDVIINPDRSGGFGITTSGDSGEWNQISKNGFKFQNRKGPKKPK